MEFTELVDLASERLGGAVVAANDEFFAEKENLLKPSAPVFVEGKHTDRGKWMDGWETCRRRTPGYDWCVVRLGFRGIIRGVLVDTSFFRGNYPESCSLEVCDLRGQPSVEELIADDSVWKEILSESKLQGDSQNLFEIKSEERASHLRFKIYPDGGVARLRVYGEVLPDWERLKRIGGDVDLAAVENGGRGIFCSDMLFWDRYNHIKPRRGADTRGGLGNQRRGGAGPRCG